MNRWRLAPEGKTILWGLLLLTLGGWVGWWPIGVGFGIAFLFCVFFFREPQIFTRSESNEILSPAYGTVVQVVQDKEPVDGKEMRTKVGIFLSVFDVHVNYAPVAGEVAYLKYEKGKFYNALRAAADEHNECQWVGIQREGGRVRVKQVAGMIARRIVCGLKLGENLAAGQRIGMIRFGSRVDVWLPANAQVCVALGDKVCGGKTVVGVLR